LAIHASLTSLQRVKWTTISLRSLDQNKQYHTVYLTVTMSNLHWFQ